MESVIQTSIPSKYYVYMAVIFLIISVCVAISVVYARRRLLATPDNVSRIKSVELKEFESFLSVFQKPRISLTDFIVKSNGPLDVTPDEKLLINYAPLSVLQPGFIGPLVNGVYDEQVGVSSAIRTGARCFVLPIDYHEDPTLKPPLFARAGDPCLLIRDEGGNIRSLNSGSIQKIAQVIADTAFGPLAFNSSDPVIIVLYFVRVPDVDKDAKEYLRFCSKVAKALAPLIPNMLGQTSEGSYNRQGKQDQLFFAPLSQFEKKIIILSNIDTSLFRTPSKAGLAAFAPRDDLDFLVHSRLFKDSEQDFGATGQMTSNQMPRAIVQTVGYYTNIPAERKKSVIDTTKIRWSLAMNPGPGTAGANPTFDSTKIVLDTYGVQCVPLLLSEKPGDLLNLWREAVWRPKPKPIRFVNPQAFVPQQPSGKLNSNQGKITSPQ